MKFEVRNSRSGLDPQGEGSKFQERGWDPFFQSRVWLLAGRFLSVLILLTAGAASAQPKSGLRLPEPLNAAEAERQGRALVADLLAQRPEQSSTNSGLMRIRDAAGHVREVPIRFDVVPQSAAWLNIYEAAPGKGGGGGERLSILHDDAKPNQYSVSAVSGGSAPGGAAKQLNGNQTMVPFAGSDFWVADLGLEFLHWSKQLLLKKEMRRSRSCNVLESVNPQPVAGSYSRVRCWIDIESGGIVLAEAYDSEDKLLKEFAPKEIKKIEGEWRLEEMEIRNLQTGSRTRVIFNME